MLRGETDQGISSHPLSGIGLRPYVVREIVRGHCGSVTVSSDKEHGTVFTVALPKHAQTAGGSAA